MTPKDRLDNPIVVGDYIAYGHALGRCAGLRIGKVLAIKFKPKQDPRYYGSEWAITVMGVDDDWGHREIALCARKGTLQFPDRIIVLDHTAVPLRYIDLLVGVK